MFGRAQIAFLAAVAATALVVSAPAFAGTPAPQYPTLTITRSGEYTLPRNIAVRAGQPVVLNVFNYSREYHTFTIRSLGVSVLVRPATAALWPRVTTVRFTVTKRHGTFVWECVICPSGNHRTPHAMDGRVYLTVA